MQNDVFSFLWSVPEKGYKWIEGRVAKQGGELEDRPTWVLTDNLTVGQEYRMKQYAPLFEFTGLFRTFANIPYESRDAILGFANEYGVLGISKILALPRTNAKPVATVEGFPMGWGETLSDWEMQIDEMRRAIFIWEMVENRDELALKKFIRWQDAVPPRGHSLGGVAGWVYDSHPDLPPIWVDPVRGAPSPQRTTQLIQPVLDLFRPGDVLVPASFMVQRWINNHLQEHVAPRLVYQLDRGKRVMQIVPSNLLSAMWLQFAQAIDGSRKYRKCKECGTWFELSHKQSEHRTVRRLFCSDQCKSKDYRDRKDRAKRLMIAGKSIKDISKELNTDSQTLKKWLAKEKR